ncbi:hypothetical protein MMPV_008261 [Pyropia vietnamensis]
MATTSARAADGNSGRRPPHSTGDPPPRPASVLFGLFIATAIVFVAILARPPRYADTRALDSAAVGSSRGADSERGDGGSAALPDPVSVVDADLTALTRILVDIPSVSGSEGPLGRWVSAALAARGWGVATQAVAPLEGRSGGERFNVVAVWRGVGAGGATAWAPAAEEGDQDRGAADTIANIDAAAAADFVTAGNAHGSRGQGGLSAVEMGRITVLLSTHLDTVGPWYASSLDADGVLRGRGVVDAKGLAAAMVIAAERLGRGGWAAPGTVGLLLVCGEETDHGGMKAAAALPLRPAYLLNGEPTTGAIGRSQKGMARFVLAARGVAGHSGTPASGASATHALLAIGAALLASPPLPPPSTLNVGTLSGGAAANVIADTAAAGVMLRLAPGVSVDAATTALTAAVHSAVADWRAAEARRGGGVDGVTVDVTAGTANAGVSFVVPPRAAAQPAGVVDVAYNTDVPYAASWVQAGAVLYGIGDIRVAHTADEAVGVAEMEAGVDGYVKIVEELLEMAAALSG